MAITLNGSTGITDADGGTVLNTNDFASQAQAEAGTNNTTLMTPLRVQQNADVNTTATASTRFGATVVSNKTSSRATATTYQNTTSGWLLVCFTMSNNGQTLLVGPTSSVTITALSANSANMSATYLVPPSWYYRATGTVMNNWSEGQA
jgi:hypothetical protein